MTAQLDLFGEVEAAESLAEQRRRERAEWAARFERADWVAPYDTQGGTKKGQSCPGWRCPDPDCGEIEPNAFLLSINHGFDPGVPGRQAWNGLCTSRRAAERRAAQLITVHCFTCPHVERGATPQDAHDLMEGHYAARHALLIASLAGDARPP